MKVDGLAPDGCCTYSVGDQRLDVRRELKNSRRHGFQSKSAFVEATFKTEGCVCEARLLPGE